MKNFLSFILVLSSLSVWAQWSTDPAVNNLLTPTGIDGYHFGENENGAAIILYNDIEAPGMVYYFQIIDQDGYLLYPDGGELLCNHPNATYSVVNDLVSADNNGNFIAVASDYRHGESYHNFFTAYKISPDGDMLWGENGICLDNTPSDLLVGMNMIHLVDNSIIFAWTSYTLEGTIEAIIQRRDEDGALIWETVLGDATTNCSFPFVLDAGNNELNLIYATGSSNSIMVNKLNVSNGETVWSDAVLVYDGGFGYVSIWNALSYTSDGDGGVFITWDDNRNLNDLHPTFLSHILSNGDYGLSVGAGGLRLGYNDSQNLRANSPKVVYDKENEFAYITWREFDMVTQSWQRIIAQKVNLAGELLWSNQGVEIVPLAQQTYSFQSVQLDNDNNIIVFYMSYHSGADQRGYAILTDGETGSPLWNEHTMISTVSSPKSGLSSTPLINGQFWLTHWNDERSGNYQAVAQRLFLDGGFETIEPPSGCTITCPENIILEVEPVVFSAIVEYVVEFQCEISTELAQLVQVEGLASGAYFPIGTTNNVFHLLYEDEILASCSFDVTLEKNDRIEGVNESPFSIYPNPTSGKVKIENETSRIENIQLFDLYGKMLFEKSNINDHQIQIDLSNFSDGLYFIRINNQLMKVVKQ